VKNHPAHRVGCRCADMTQRKPVEGVRIRPLFPYRREYGPAREYHLDWTASCRFRRRAPRFISFGLPSRVNDYSLPESVRRLIAEHVDSAESLEILLFLHRNPGRSFTAEVLSPEVYTVAAAALLRLEGLVSRGFARSDQAANPAYRYAPSSPQLARQVDELADAYRANRVAVIQAIFQKPNSAAQSLADAFRLRGN
jgi:hypothetical protein